jgi:hypothetical protein
MAFTTLGRLGEIATAIAHHGLLTYIGTNLGNLYSMVNTTGVFTLLDSVGEKIVSMTIEHPTIYLSTNKGNVYSYAITVSGDKAESQSIGSQANTAGSGVPVSTTYPGSFRVFSDDAGLNIADSVRGIQSRFLLTVDHSAGTIRAMQGQLKLATGVDVTTGVYTALQGYVEMVGTHICKTGAYFSAIDASVEIGTSLTVDSGGSFYGLHVETTGAGTITNNGLCAGIGITKAVGAPSWPYGIYIVPGSATAGLVMGQKSSSAALGHPIGVANSGDTAGDKAIAIFADDANAVLASDAQGINSRCLILAAQTGTYGMTALRGHLRIVASVTPSASKGFYGTESYVEASGTYTIGNGSALAILAAAGASVELGGTPTIAANAVVCGLHISGKTLPASPTGEAVGILFQALSQGYEHAFGFTGVGTTDGNGLVVQSGGTNTYTHKIKVWISGVGTKYIGVGDIA